MNIVSFLRSLSLTGFYRFTINRFRRAFFYAKKILPTGMFLTKRKLPLAGKIENHIEKGTAPKKQLYLKKLEFL